VCFIKQQTNLIERISRIMLDIIITAILLYSTAQNTKTAYHKKKLTLMKPYFANFSIMGNFPCTEAFHV